jgi:hypothetical protein
VASDVQYDGGMLRATFTVSSGGVLLYEPGGNVGPGNMDLVWLDQAARPWATSPNRPNTRGYIFPRTGSG